MRIGLLGLAFGSGNKGCEALGYGFLQILQFIASKRETVFDIDIFEVCDVCKIYNTVSYENLRLNSVFVPGIGSINHLREHKKAYGKCYMVFDFTAGDSFSDIYGMERFIRRTIIKILAIKSKSWFVLGSQTYGPYKNFFSKIMASYVFNNSYKVYARDYMSVETVQKMSRADVVQTIDVAFAMPYKKSNNSSKKLAGFNPSGLLWAGGYTGNNQFELKVEYKEYCRKTIAMLCNCGYEVVLVSHVLSTDMNQKDNDVIACQELHKEFPETLLAPFFDNPVDAKSFISGLELFIGARMHATIAAISTMVPVLPFSYSRKFEGLFSSMDYKYVISGTKISTEKALIQTKIFVNELEYIRTLMPVYQQKIANGIEEIINETERIIFTLKEKK